MYFYIGASSDKSIIKLEPSRKSIIRFVKPPRKLKFVVAKKLRQNIYQENIKDILLNTNATPIRGKGGLDYTCCFCPVRFPGPEDLKTHTIEKHDDKTKAEYLKGIPVQSLYIKLDITDLKCKLCGANLENVEDMVKHLELKHDKMIQTSFLKYVVPFKFNTDGLRCAVCKQPFNNMRLLMEHMHRHYSNHVCEVCGAGFINRKTFRAHTLRHDKGSFPCKVCSKVFETRIRQMEHERSVHIHGSKRSKCSYCGEKFSDYTKKNVHEVKVHGAKPVVLGCPGCDRVFDNQRSLTIHSKTCHTMEKRK